MPALDFLLHSQSDAIDRGLVLPNINDDYVGNAPDLGAVELGSEAVIYGARDIDIMPPAPPTDLAIVIQ